MNRRTSPAPGVPDPPEGNPHVGPGLSPETPEAPESHIVRCGYCRQLFELFGAAWCGHETNPHPSKICPHCRNCLCFHPSYGDALCWKDAPVVFRRNGFHKLFLLYL